MELSFEKKLHSASLAWKKILGRKNVLDREKSKEK